MHIARSANTWFSSLWGEFVPEYYVPEQARLKLAPRDRVMSVELFLWRKLFVPLAAGGRPWFSSTRLAPNEV